MALICSDVVILSREGNVALWPESFRHEESQTKFLVPYACSIAHRDNVHFYIVNVLLNESRPPWVLVHIFLQTDAIGVKTFLSSSLIGELVLQTDACKLLDLL